MIKDKKRERNRITRTNKDKRKRRTIDAKEKMKR
jgi:hypothetical protein